MMIMFKGAVTGGIVGLLIVIAVGGGAQLTQVPLETLPSSIRGCVAPYNMSTHIE